MKDFATRGRAYFDDTYDIEDKPLKKNVRKHPDLKAWLPELARRFGALDAFTPDATEQAAFRQEPAFFFRPVCKKRNRAWQLRSIRFELFLISMP